MAGAAVPLTALAAPPGDSAAGAETRPNVVIILADDVGFSDIGAFGGEIETPVLDGLAANGKKFTQFYNTARCCPTRASMLTGLYPHQAGIGHLIYNTGHIGYGDFLASDSVTLPEALRAAGYSTYMAGKWHMAPRSYDPEKDTPHWPLHAPEEEIERYRGRYDKGYEPVHAARAERLKKWGLLPEVGEIAPPVGDWEQVENKEAEVSLMETYAAILTRMDHGIGRVIEQLRESGDFDNTLILYLQDNGGCAEDLFARPTGITEPSEPMAPDELQRSYRPSYTRDGRPVRMGHDVKAGPDDTYTAYKENWANVSNSPFRLYKHYVHEGGISTPLIAHWPAEIAPTPETRVVRQPAHLIDIMPTILELAQTKQPERRHGVKVQPLEGVSLLPVLTGRGTIERDEPIFFEHEGNRAVRAGQWKIVALSETGPWELYDISVDRGEIKDLAAEHPDIVDDLAAKWDTWAARARVLPLGGWRDRVGKREDQPGKATKVILQQGEKLPRNKSLGLYGVGVEITAEILDGPVEGVIVAQGASHNGFSLYATEDVLHFVTRHNRQLGSLEQGGLPPPPFTVTASLSPEGKATLSFGDQTAEADFPGPLQSTPAQGIAAGIDTGTPVGDYPAEFPFQGKLGTVTVETVSQ